MGWFLGWFLGGIVGERHEGGVGVEEAGSEHFFYEAAGGGGIPDESFLDIGLEAAGVGIAADGQGGIAELEEA